MLNGQHFYRCCYTDNTEGIWRTWPNLLDWISRYRSIQEDGEQNLPDLHEVEGGPIR